MWQHYFEKNFRTLGFLGNVTFTSILNVLYNWGIFKIQQWAYQECVLLLFAILLLWPTPKEHLYVTHDRVPICRLHWNVRWKGAPTTADTAIPIVDKHTMENFSEIIFFFPLLIVFIPQRQRWQLSITLGDRDLSLVSSLLLQMGNKQNNKMGKIKILWLFTVPSQASS